MKLSHDLPGSRLFLLKYSKHRDMCQNGDWASWFPFKARRSTHMTVRRRVQSTVLGSQAPGDGP